MPLINSIISGPVQESAVSGPMPELTPTGMAGTTTPCETSEPANTAVNGTDLTSSFSTPPPESPSTEKVPSNVADDENIDNANNSEPQVDISSLPLENRQQQPADGRTLPLEDSQPLDEPPSPPDNGPSLSSLTLDNDTDTALPGDDVVEQTSTNPTGEYLSTEDASSECAPVLNAEDAATADKEGTTKNQGGGSSAATDAQDVSVDVGREISTANEGMGDGGATSASAHREILHTGCATASVDVGGADGEGLAIVSTTAAIDDVGDTSAVDGREGLAAVAIDDGGATSAAANSGGLVNEPTATGVVDEGATSDVTDRKGLTTASETRTSNEVPTPAGDPKTDDRIGEATEPMLERGCSDGVAVETAPTANVAHRLSETPFELEGGEVRASIDQVSPMPTGTLSLTGGDGNMTNRVDSEHSPSTLTQPIEVITPEWAGGDGGGEREGQDDPQRSMPQPDGGGNVGGSEQGTEAEVKGSVVVISGEQGSGDGKNGDDPVRPDVVPAVAIDTMDGYLWEEDAHVEAKSEGVADKHGGNEFESRFQVPGPESGDCKEARVEGEVAGEGPEKLTIEEESSVPEAIATRATAATDEERSAADDSEDFLTGKTTVTSTTTTATTEEQLVAEETEEHLKETTAAPKTAAVTAEAPLVAEETLQEQRTTNDLSQPENLHIDQEELLLVKSEERLKVNSSGGGPTNISAAGATNKINPAAIVAAAAASGRAVGQDISGGTGSIIAKIETNEEEPAVDPTEDIDATVAEDNRQLPAVECSDGVGQNIASGSDTTNEKIDVNEEEAEVDSTDVAAATAENSSGLPNSSQLSGAVPVDASFDPAVATNNSGSCGGLSILSDSVADPSATGQRTFGGDDRSSSISVDASLDSPPEAVAAAVAARDTDGADDMTARTTDPAGNAYTSSSAHVAQPDYGMGGAAAKEPAATEMLLGPVEEKQVDDSDHSLSPASTTTWTAGAGNLSESEENTAVTERAETKSQEAKAESEVTSVETPLEQEEVDDPDRNTAGGAVTGGVPAKVTSGDAQNRAEPERNDGGGASNVLFEEFEELSSSAGEDDDGIISSLEGGAISSSIEGVDVHSFASGEESLGVGPSKLAAGAGQVGEPLTNPSNDNTGG